MHCLRNKTLTFQELESEPVIRGLHYFVFLQQNPLKTLSSLIVAKLKLKHTLLHSKLRNISHFKIQQSGYGLNCEEKVAVLKVHLKKSH